MICFLENDDILNLTILSWFSKVAQSNEEVQGGDKATAGVSGGGNGGSAGGGSSKDKDPRKTNRTTRMLLVVVVLFLVTELPQGVLNLLSGVLPAQFVQEVSCP